MPDNAMSTAVTLPITLTINGTTHDLTVAPWTTLLDLLRLDLDLTGTKKGCDHGQCSACTVLVNGTSVNSCLALAVMNDGAAITTVEGLAATEGCLHPLQTAFIEQDAFQCGYRTPGQLCSAAGLILEANAHTPSDMRAPGAPLGVFGIGMALFEESLTDPTIGRVMNRNLAEYHVPANADVPDIDVIFVDEHDDKANPLCVKGLGEIGIVGTAAAIANAIFHATGKPVRDLPVTIDKLRNEPA